MRIDLSGKTAGGIRLLRDGSVIGVSGSGNQDQTVATAGAAAFAG